MRDAARRAPAAGLVLALLCLVTSIGPANATSVLVPDDYPTIQQAIDSGADTVVVKEGRYEEDLEIVGTDVTLLAEKRPGGWWFVEVIAGGLHATADVLVEGFRFTRPVRFEAGPPHPNPVVRLESCRFDAPFEVEDFVTFLYARGCMFFGNLTIRPYLFEFVGSTFIGAYVDAAYEGDARLLSNAFVGPGEFAIRVRDYDSGFRIANNTITGKVNGVIIEGPANARVEGNYVSSCSGSAFRCESRGAPGGGPSGRVNFTGNRVRSCRGHGFDCDNVFPDFVDNVVDSVGGDGIRMVNSVPFWVRGNRIRHVGGRGISADHVAAGISGNTVVDTGSDGIAANYASHVDSNVVGRARGNGLSVARTWEPGIRHNTVYACTGDGIYIADSPFPPDSLTANIAYANGGAGLNFTGTGSMVLTCNDWQANTGGATVGIAPGPTDLAVDPLFCNVVEDDVTLTSASPLLDAPGCGQIGALGQGCEISISGPFGAHPSADRFRVFPHPAHDRVTFAWPAGGGPVRLEVFDVTGARRWQADAPAGTAEMSWGLDGMDGARLPAGVYWARLTRGGEALHSRIVRIR